MELCLCLRQTVYFLRALTSELAAGKCRYSISDHPRRIRRTCLDDEVLMIGFREILGWWAFVVWRKPLNSVHLIVATIFLFSFFVLVSDAAEFEDTSTIPLMF